MPKVRIEFKVVFSGGSVRKGFMGGRRWGMHVRLLVDGDPTDWVNKMEYPKTRTGPGGSELKTTWRGALSKMTNYKVSPKRIKRIEGKARGSEWPEWTSDGGYGYSEKKRHWIIG